MSRYRQPREVAVPDRTRPELCRAHESLLDTSIASGMMKDRPVVIGRSGPVATGARASIAAERQRCPFRRRVFLYPSSDSRTTVGDNQRFACRPV